MEIIHKVDIDLLKPRAVQMVFAMQADENSRVLEISLSANGQAWNIPEDVSFSVAYSKPDKTRGIYDTLPDGTSAATFNENVVSVKLAPQMLTAHGLVQASVVMTDSGMNRLNTFPVTVNVIANPSVGATESKDYYSLTTIAAIGDLNDLETKDKSSVVAAINQLAKLDEKIDTEINGSFETVPKDVVIVATESQVIHDYKLNKRGELQSSVGWNATEKIPIACVAGTNVTVHGAFYATTAGAVVYDSKGQTLLAITGDYAESTYGITPSTVMQDITFPAPEGMAYISLCAFTGNSAQGSYAGASSFTIAGTIEETITISPVVREEQLNELQAQLDKVKEGDYELIEATTLTEDTEVFLRTQEPDGTPYNFKRILVMAVYAATTASNSVTVNYECGKNLTVTGISHIDTSPRYAYTEFFSNHGFFDGFTTSASSSKYGGVTTPNLPNYSRKTYKLHRIEMLQISASNAAIPAGTVFNIYGVRA